MLRSDNNISFLHPRRGEFKRATVNSWPITEQINGIRYYRLRAVKSGTKSELSRWSVPAKLEQYSTAIERVRSDDGRLKVFVSQSDDQGVFRFDKPEYDGFDIRLIARIEEELRRRLSISATSLENAPKVKAVPWEQLLSAPKEQGADVIISSITSLAQREETYGIRFTLPYYCVSQSLVYREEKKPERLKQALQGRVIGVQKDTTSESLLNDIRREADTEPFKFKIESFADTSLIFEALSDRRIDYGIMDTPFATAGLMRYGTLHHSELTAEDMPRGRQSVERYALAVKSSEKELLEYINSILGKLKETRQIDELFRSAQDDFIKTVIKGEHGALTTIMPYCQARASRPRRRLH